MNRSRQIESDKYPSMARANSSMKGGGLILRIMLVCLCLAPIEAKAGPQTRQPEHQPTQQTEPLPAWVLPRSLQLIRAKQFEEARELLQPIVSAHPKWAKATFYLALTYQEQSRYEQSRDLCKRALEIDPEYHTVLMFLGWAHYYLAELDDARDAFEAYRKVKPNYPDVHFALGLIAFDEDRIDQALAHYQTAIDLSLRRKDVRSEAKSRARMADVLVRQGKLDDARLALEKSIELNPNNYEAYFKLSRVLQRLGDHKGAERARKMHEEVRAKSLAKGGRGERRPGE